MKTDCTELFFNFREIARVVWNLGFWPNRDLRDSTSIVLYEEAVARIFEATVLHALGCEGRVPRHGALGAAERFLVNAKTCEAKMLVDKNGPEKGVHIWGVPTVKLLRGSSYRLSFVDFFDWSNMDRRDFRLLKVVIERFDQQPELIGRHALIELDSSTIGLDDDLRMETIEGQRRATTARKPRPPARRKP